MINGGNRRDDRRRHGHGQINACGIHLAVREHRDGALMVGLGGIRVEPFVQRWRGRHRVEQQHQAGQNQGKDRPALALTMARYESHNVRKLADVFPAAREFPPVEFPQQAVLECASLLESDVTPGHIPMSFLYHPDTK